MRYWILILLCVVTSVQAEVIVYRWLDADGNTNFSDAPHPNAERIELNILPGYAPTPVPDANSTADTTATSESNTEDPNAVPDYQISIINPTNDQSVWANDGNVAVGVQVEPAINPERADKVLFELDGQVVGEPQEQGSYVLSNVDRGSHSIAATVVDSDGNELARSESVTFFVHRATVKMQQNSTSQN